MRAPTIACGRTNERRLGSFEVEGGAGGVFEIDVGPEDGGGDECGAPSRADLSGCDQVPLVYPELEQSCEHLGREPVDGP